MLKRVIAFCLALGLVAAMPACSYLGSKDVGISSGDMIEISISFWEPSTSQEMEKAFTALSEKYNKIKPNIKIKLLPQPVNGYQEWIKAQFATNNAPIIEYNNPDLLWDQYKSGLVIDIKEALNAPNPYADNQIWRDLFLDGKLEAATNYKAEPTFVIPLSGLGLAYFYNTEIYEKLGLKIPKTWDEFMKNCEVIKQDGINPIAFMAQKKDSVQWLSWYITTGMFGDEFLADNNINVNGDNNIDAREAARAVNSGHFNIVKNSKFKGMYETYLEMVEQYAEYAQNSTGLDEAGAKAQFLSGKAAHIMSGSWDIQSFIASENKQFKISAFAFPKFTKENSPYAGENMIITGVQPLAITKSAEQSEEVKAASIDFLQFITAPENYKIFVETTYSMPIVKDLDVDPVFKAFQGGTRPLVSLFSYAGKKAQFTSLDAMVTILSGEKISTENLLKKVQNSNELFVDDIKDRYSVSEADDFGVDSIPFIGGEFKPSGN